MAGAVNFWVNPKDGESSEKRVSRFKQWYNRSRISQLVKSRRYRTKKASRRQARDGAKVREAYRAKREREKYYQ